MKGFDSRREQRKAVVQSGLTQNIIKILHDKLQFSMPEKYNLIGAIGTGGRGGTSALYCLYIGWKVFSV